MGCMPRALVIQLLEVKAVSISVPQDSAQPEILSGPLGSRQKRGIRFDTIRSKESKSGSSETRDPRQSHRFF